MIDGVPYQLKAPFDFTFMQKFGKVFKVFDEQESGNICFGVEKNSRRHFVKFAGAPTVSYPGKPEDAVSRLRDSVPVYKDLAHPHLIRLLDAEEIGNGFAVVFEWVDAVCMGKQYPDEREKFMRLPIEKKLQAYWDIMEFHAHVAAKKYVAIDFYDASIMYGFENAKTVVCDVDFYQKAPYYGDMGLWGSTRFVSPEERTNGALLDEVTNVYTMGATAFALFSNSDRSREAWPLSAELFAVVAKAVNPERGGRQQSIRRLMEEWRAAK